MSKTEKFTIGLIGLGGAGVRIADQYRRIERNTTHRETTTDRAIAVDTAVKSLKQHTKKHRFFDRILFGGETFDKRGTGADITTAIRVAYKNQHPITEHIMARQHVLDAVVVISSAGGGTGGTTPVILNTLTEKLPDETYLISVLVTPHNNEHDQYSRNAKATVQYADALADSVILVSNDHLNVSEPTDTDTYSSFDPTETFTVQNQRIALTLHQLFSAPNNITQQTTTNDTNTPIVADLFNDTQLTCGICQETLPKSAQQSLTGKIKRVKQTIRNPETELTYDNYPFPLQLAAKSFDLDSLLVGYPDKVVNAKHIYTFIETPSHMAYDEDSKTITNWVAERSNTNNVTTTFMSQPVDTVTAVSTASISQFVPQTADSEITSQLDRYITIKN